MARIKFDPYITVEFIEFAKDKPCLRVDDVAKFFSVKPRTVRKWIERGELHAVKVGKALIIPRAALWEFIKMNTEEF